MKSRKFIEIVSIATLILFAFTARSDDKPADKVSEPLIGEMRIQTLPAMNYYCTSLETSFAKLGEAVSPLWNDLAKMLHDEDVKWRGQTLHIYRDAHFQGTPDRVFKMELGLLVNNEPKPAGVFKVRKVGEFKCATMLYTGHFTGQGKVYEKIYPAIARANLTPTGETREMCLFWEAPDSINNIFQIQVGIK